MDGAAFWRLAQLIWRAFLAVLAGQAYWMDMIILTRTNKPDQMKQSYVVKIKTNSICGRRMLFLLYHS